MEYEMTKNSVGVIISLGLLVISILSIVGLGYLTKFSFNSDSSNDTRCVKLTNTELSLCKMTTVLLWINIIMGILGGVFVYIR